MYSVLITRCSMLMICSSGCFVCLWIHLRTLYIISVIFLCQFQSTDTKTLFETLKERRLKRRGQLPPLNRDGAGSSPPPTRPDTADSTEGSDSTPSTLRERLRQRIQEGRENKQASEVHMFNLVVEALVMELAFFWEKGTFAFSIRICNTKFVAKVVLKPHDTLCFSWENTGSSIQ